MAATQQLLAEVGYDDLTLALVAERAGTSRPALYRRWPSKGHLVYDALFPSPGDEIPIDAPKRLSILINMAVVRQLGLYPPMNLLGLAEGVDPAGNKPSEGKQP